MNNDISHSLNTCTLGCVRCNTSKSMLHKFGKREIKHDNLDFVD